LKNTLSSANLILLCHQEGTRFDPEMFKMITEMESLFGRGRLWNNVMLEVTHWAYDQNSIKARESHGRNETTALKEVNDMIKKNSHLNQSLEGIFLDSYAVQEWNLDDEVQQTYFQLYAQQLWEAAVARGNFSFLTIEDILEQLDEALTENDRLHDVIDENLTYLNETTAQLRRDVNSNDGDISSLQSKADKHGEFCMLGYESQKVMSTGDPLKYDYVTESSGSGSMSLSTGMFTAEVSGIYTFTLSGTVGLDNEEMIRIVPYSTDGHQLAGQFYSHNRGSGGKSWDQAAKTFVLGLSAGKQMYWMVTQVYGHPEIAHMTYCVTLNY